jgi:hypothetical protein
MPKAGNDVVAVPSDTLIPMLLNEPTSATAGVPVRRPVEVLNVAQLGLFEMLNVSVSPSASVALGWKLYAVPAITEVAGVPLMVGARLVVALIWIVNDGNEAVAIPSLAVIVIRPVVPTFAADGVPVSRPVVVLNVAQLG